MKRIALFCLLAGTAGEARAQQSPVSFGLKGGVLITTVGGEDARLDAASFIPAGGIGAIGGFDLTAEPQSKTLFAGGAYLSYALHPMLAVQAEVMYATKGVLYDRDFSYSFFGTSISGNLNADAELSYLEIPLLLKFILPVEGPIKPYVYAGPSFGKLLDDQTVIKAHIKTNITGDPIETDVPIPADFTYKSLDIGAAFGGGISVRMAGTALGVEARYTMGLQSAVESVDIRDEESGQTQTIADLDMKNRAFGISAFMEFYF